MRSIETQGEMSSLGIIRLVSGSLSVAGQRFFVEALDLDNKSYGKEAMLSAVATRTIVAHERFVETKGNESPCLHVTSV